MVPARPTTVVVMLRAAPNWEDYPVKSMDVVGVCLALTPSLVPILAAEKPTEVAAEAKLSPCFE